MNEKWVKGKGTYIPCVLWCDRKNVDNKVLIILYILIIIIFIIINISFNIKQHKADWSSLSVCFTTFFKSHHTVCAVYLSTTHKHSKVFFRDCE